MSNNKPINVKVSTEKVLKALKESRDKRVKDLAVKVKEISDYELAVKVFEKKIIEELKKGKCNIISCTKVRYWSSDGVDKYEMTFGLPAGLVSPTETEYTTIQHPHNLKEQIAELDNAIALLMMTDETVISTNTYSGVAKYI